MIHITAAANTGDKKEEIGFFCSDILAPRPGTRMRQEVTVYETPAYHCAALWSGNGPPGETYAALENAWRSSSGHHASPRAIAARMADVVPEGANYAIAVFCGSCVCTNTTEGSPFFLLRDRQRCSEQVHSGLVRRVMLPGDRLFAATPGFLENLAPSVPDQLYHIGDAWRVADFFESHPAYKPRDAIAIVLELRRHERSASSEMV